MLSPRPKDIEYIDYKDFLYLLFGIIEEHLNYDPNDPLPDYRKENAESLDKILTFVRDDELYPTLITKAAYLFVSITDGHVYSNGNKRLGLITTVYFLAINGYDLDVKFGELYDLSLFVADRSRNSAASFDQLKTYAEKFINDHLSQNEA